MYKIVLVLLILVWSATSAGAHHHRHHRHHYHPERSRSEVTPPSDSTGGVIPLEWKKQSFDQRLNGGRFVSPDRSASFDFYTTAADDQPVTEHIKNFAFGDGDEITSLAGEQTWIEASGSNGDGLFYRKAVLACGGARWHHIAFEYPPNARRSMQDFIRRAVEMIDSTPNEGCDTPLSKSPKDGNSRSAEQSSQ